MKHLNHLQSGPKRPYWGPFWKDFCLQESQFWANIDMKGLDEVVLLFRTLKHLVGVQESN